MKHLLASAAVAWITMTATANASPKTRDGLQLRFAVGPGYNVGTLDAPAGESGSTGVAVNTQIAIGWTLRPGLVVGAGTFPAVTPSPSYDGVDAGGQHVSATGPFIDYYLSPTSGLHGFAGVLFTAGYLDGGDREGNVGFGWGATAGVGYDHFISDNWSIGGIARITVYQLYGVDDSIRLVTPAALLTVTRH
ncbi:MAG: hypothetical protein ACKV2T_03990 [Kofleriaceae bacterium]